MLLIDGAKYNLWSSKEVDIDEVRDFHPIVEGHSKEIFGDSSEYFKGSKLSSIQGISRIPDGIVIIFSDSPCWHIVEIELSEHDLHKHIVYQVTDFISALNNPETRRKIVERINKTIKENEPVKVQVKKRIEPEEDIHEFLTNVINKPPILTVVIENNGSRAEEVLKRFRNHPDVSDIKVVEFQTFVRRGCDLSVHAHLFEPLYVDVKIDFTRNKTGVGQQLKHIVTKGEINYHRIKLKNDETWFFPTVDQRFKLETDSNIYTAYLDRMNPPRIRGISKWFSTHPIPREGNKIIFEVIEPMKRYRLRKA